MKILIPVCEGGGGVTVVASVRIAITNLEMFSTLTAKAPTVKNSSLFLRKLINKPSMHAQHVQWCALQKNIPCRTRVLYTYMIWCQVTNSYACWRYFWHARTNVRIFSGVRVFLRTMLYNNTVQYHCQKICEFRQFTFYVNFNTLIYLTYIHKEESI